MATLKSITAYEGRFILEYSGGAEGKPASRFVIENPPEDPLPAGNSLNEAKRVIDGLEGKSTSRPPVSKGLGGSPACDESRTAPPQVCPPHVLSVVDDSILNALRDRVSQDHGSVRRIARFLSVHSGVILEWLAGTRKPRQATLERIAAYLKGPVIRA
jgi:hypothetical protein